ncbi:MAG: SCP2 sterol-binding domain-containing protein [Promethearchaeia archaeon]
MVDKELLKELKEKLEKGPEAADPDDTLKGFELLKQFSKENEEIQEFMEEMDIKVQFEIFDIDKFYWLSVKDGKLDYGKGKIEDPSFTMGTSMDIAVTMLFNEYDPVSAYMAGEIIIEGDLPAAMEFQDIINVAMEMFGNLINDL